jgi:nitrogen fixation-related uncharacterized protein
MGADVFRSLRPKFEEVEIMNEATIALIIMSSLIILIFLGFLIWGIASGQFKGVEDAKYQALKSDSEIAEEMKLKPIDKSRPGENKC